MNIKTNMSSLNKLIEEFDEKFTLPAKTVLDRDSCTECQEMIKKGEKNSIGRQCYCCAFHAYEKVRVLGESFSQDEPPKPQEIKSFLTHVYNTALQDAKKEVVEKLEEERTVSVDQFVFVALSKVIEKIK